MAVALWITRTDYTGQQLRALSGRCTDGAQVRRLLALALVLEGHSRTEAARLNGMDRQTLRDWVHRYNAEGVEGLKSRPSPGRAPALSEQQMAELRELVIQGPDPAIHKVVRWRCVDLQAEVARRFSVADLVRAALPEAAIGRPLEIWFQSLPSRRRGTRPGSARRAATPTSGCRSAHAP